MLECWPEWRREIGIIPDRLMLHQRRVVHCWVALCFTHGEARCVHTCSRGDHTTPVASSRQ